MSKNTFVQRTVIWQVHIFILCIFYKMIYGQIQYSVYEELKPGSIIGNIANDLNLSINELSVRKFHIASHDRKQFISVNLDNGDLFVRERIDRETLCGLEPQCILDLKAMIENPLQIFTIKVEINDINDNEPSFSKKSFEVEVSEFAVPGARFALDYAQDPDLGTNSVQSYGLSANKYFSLGERTSSDGSKYPELVLEKHLDREKQSSLELSLIASDGGSPKKTCTASVKIVVHDANDNYPVFTQDTYVVNINEDAPNSFLVLQLQAADEDDGTNAQITYSFSHIPENARQIFTINPQTGEIRKTGHLDYEVTKRYTITVEARDGGGLIFAINPLNGSVQITGKLDYEAATNYEMTIEAKDGGGLVSYCKLLVQVSDVNDNAPDILITSFSDIIPEDSPVGTVIALVNLDDLDSGENGEVVGQISESLPFHLISSSGNYYKLVTSMALDRETTPEYNITIKAEDKGSPQLTNSKTIRLILTDVNDNAPVFDKMDYVAYIKENNPSGNSFYRVHATDPDINENGKVVYMILTDNIEDIPLSSYISINTVSGVLYAQRSFDYEKLREFNIQVMAKDSGSPSRSANATVKICITDQNDNAPKILYPSQDSEAASVFEFIPHFSTKGYLVTKVVAVDADSGHNAWLSYHLLQVPDPSFLIIGQNTGEIRITRDLQETDALRQRIVVMVKDNGYPMLSSTVTLNLVVAENFQQVLPEITNQHIETDTRSNATFYLVISIAIISILFIFTVLLAVISKCRKQSSPTALHPLSRDLYPQVALRCPSVFSDGTLPFPYTYDVCVTLDSRQNEVAYLKPPHSDVKSVGEPHKQEICFMGMLNK
uniref:Protocadherin gamma-C3 n=1 Tax=Xenopus tropicalis TaxID=8364 RepID=A0A6I8S1H2_XENTR